MLYIASDHAGYKLKEQLKVFFKKNNTLCKDLGDFRYNENDDYPEFGAKVGRAVAKNASHRGIVICGGGNGICIAANKIRGVRAALCFTPKDAKNARNDENANVLCLGARVISSARAKLVSYVFLTTPFSKAKRHARRVKKIQKLERSKK